MIMEDWMICGFLATAGFALLHLLASAREAALVQAQAAADARAKAERMRNSRLEQQEANAIAQNSDVCLV
ncbi:MAG: hypothetical protein ACE5EQ_05640 [Phycisphaerae bacterium]